MGEYSDRSTDLPTVPLWIDCRPYMNPETTRFPVFSSKQKRTVAFATSADVSLATKAAESAGHAQASWSFTAAQRRELLDRFAALIKEREQELVDIQKKETSCSETWARFNITYSFDMIREIAARITAACTGELPPMTENGTLGFVVRKPIGTVLLIAPWNAAVILAARSIASILGAGCTLVFKASELCPQTHHMLLQLLLEAGLPANVVAVIQTAREDAASVTEALISHPAIRKIEFIGSAPIGKIIGSIAGRYLKPVLMELGGKCAAVILEDADIKDAAKKCINGAFIQHGQVCFSTERVVVERSIANDFIELLKECAREWRPARDSQFDHGVNERIVQASYDKLIDAQRKGATFLLGEPAKMSDTSLKPAIMTNVTKDMDVWDEETFGPSTTVIVADDESDAVDIVNQSSYGLDAFIFTRNMEKAVNIASRLEVGRVRVNASGHEPTFPSAPVKNSGFGANNSGHGIEEFLVKQVVTMDFR